MAGGDLKAIPIVLMDIVGFTSDYVDHRHRRAAVQALQRILQHSAQFFLPYGDAWDLWKPRQSTGDGYYLPFPGRGPQVALQYCLNVRDALIVHNAAAGLDLPLRLRMVLQWGDLEFVGDTVVSDAYNEAERLGSDAAFKAYASTHSQRCAVVASDLFHYELTRTLRDRVLFAGLEALVWTPITVTDKHGHKHKGYVLGEDFKTHELPSPAPARFRVAILIGHFLQEPLPEAVEMALRAARAFERSGLHVDVRIDTASVSGLARVARGGCDLLLYYGHGSSDGQISFADGLKSYGHLSEAPTLRSIWEQLEACVVFACYGDRFAVRLPCPWISFTGPILRLAPRGFVEAAVEHLKQLDLRSAIDVAHRAVATEMRSDFSQVMRFSDVPFPSHRIAVGTPILTRLSCGLAGRTRVDFESTVQGSLVRYPEHDPFVGRVDQLVSLLKIPSTREDGPLQRVVWVHGDAGMGKSALLRQLAVQVRDLVFHEHDEPVYLLHLYCYRYTRASEVLDALCAAASRLYELDPALRQLADVCAALEKRPGVHFWILDDLTYLSSIGSERSDDASDLVLTIRSAFTAHALPLELVVSARREGPLGCESIRVAELTVAEALDLARIVHRLAEHERGSVTTQVPDLHGALGLFSLVHKHTAHFKRSLHIAARRRQTYGDYVARLPRDLRDIRDADALSRRMVAFEVEGLRDLTIEDGFDYDGFLKRYYRLVARASYITVPDLVRWFGDDLRVGASDLTTAEVYELGLTYLSRLGFTMPVRRSGGQAFALPPNQRVVVRSLDEPSRPLPAGIPLRGAAERLSLALERVRALGLAAVGDVLEMEHDYRDALDHPDAAAAVLYAMTARAELFRFFADDASEDDGSDLAIYDEIVAIYDRHRHHFLGSDVRVSEAVASALINKGIRLGRLGHFADEIATYDEVMRRFGRRAEPTLSPQLAHALIKKGMRLGSLGQPVEAIATYDEVVRRFGDGTEADVAEQVGAALLNKAFELRGLGRLREVIATYDEVVRRSGERTEADVAEQGAIARVNTGTTLSELGRLAEAIATYDEVVRRFGERVEPALVEQVAKALINKGVTLGNFGQATEAIASYDDVVRRFGEHTEPKLMEHVAIALVNKGSTLGNLGRLGEAIAAYDEVVRSFGQHTEPDLAEQVAVAMVNKGISLGSLGQPVEAIATYDEVVRRFGERMEPSIVEQVAIALLNKGITLGLFGQSAEAIATYDEMVQRFGGRAEPRLAERVATAMVNKGVRLNAVGQPAEAIAASDEVVRRFGERTELALAQQVAITLVNKGITLGDLGRLADEIATYDEVVRRFGERTEPDLAERVVKALINKGIALGELGQPKEAIATYDEVVRRFGERAEPALAERVAKAFLNKAAKLGGLGQAADEIATYGEVVRRFGERAEPALVEQVVIALVNRRIAVGKLGKPGDDIATYDEVVRRFGERVELGLIEQVAIALVNKGKKLGNLGDPAIEIATYDEVLRRFGSRAEPTIANQVGIALVNKGIALGRLGQPAEEIATCDEVVARFGERVESDLADSVAKALLNKGITLIALGLLAEAIATSDEVVRRFGERLESALAELVAISLINKGIALAKLGQPAEEIATYDEVVRRFGERAESAIADSVAKALFNKGNTLGTLGQAAEAIETYDELVRRFGGRTEPTLADRVADALLNKGIALGTLGQRAHQIATYDEVVRRFGQRTELVQQVAVALINKGSTLGELGQLAEATETYDELVRRFGERPDLALAQLVAVALINRGITLGKLGQRVEEMATYDEVLRRFGQRTEPALADLVTMACQRANRAR